MILHPSTVQTHHFVDDEVPELYFTLSDFIQLSGFSVMNCNPSPDGRSMTYHVNDDRLTGIYLQHARVIIRVFGMPFLADHGTEVKDGRIRAFLTIKYTGK